MSEIVSAVIFGIFLLLLVIGAISTLLRFLRYWRADLHPPVLLFRDRDLLVGLAFPFVLIAAARVFAWNVRQADGSVELYWLLLTGLPPIYALARYCYFELFVIERGPRQ